MGRYEHSILSMFHIEPGCARQMLRVGRKTYPAGKKPVCFPHYY